MRKMILLSAVAAMMPLTTIAQDDMYFVPTKANVEEAAEDYGVPRDTYYSGSDRSVDEYNRRPGKYAEYAADPTYGGSSVTLLDSVGNDIITFDSVAGVYPDSVSDMVRDSMMVDEEDYKCTREMSRWDDYEWTDPYWAGFYAGRYSSWGWYDPWYDWTWGWYSPWYYSSWYGWYNWGWPYYSYGWGWPYYGGWHGHIYAGGWHGGHGRYGNGALKGTNNRYRGGHSDRLSGGNGSLRNNLASSRSITKGISSRDRAVRGSFAGRSNFNASSRFGNRTNTTSRSSNNFNSTRYSNSSSNQIRQSSSNFSNRSFSGGSRSSFSGGGGFSGGSRGGGGFGGGGRGRR